MALLAVSILLFLAVHLVRVVAPGLRRSAISALGRPVWITFHSVLSIATLALLVWTFAEARAVTGMLYNPPAWMSHITLTLMLIACVCLAASALPAGYIRTKTKFPLLVAIKIWAFSHLLANGETSSVMLFGAFLIWAVVLRISLKKRVASGEVVARPFVSSRYDIFAVALGILIWAAIVFDLHETLIGVSPLVAM
ncbi:NnrU family protein [Rhizobium sp. PAMB 3174]